MSAGEPLTRRQMREIAEREERQRAEQADARERSLRAQAQPPAAQPQPPAAQAPVAQAPAGRAPAPQAPPAQRRSVHAPAPQAAAPSWSAPAQPGQGGPAQVGRQPAAGPTLPQRAPVPAVQPTPTGPSRRATLHVPDLEPSPRSRPAPTVVPPAVTGAMRTVDHTGRITPVVPVDQTGRTGAVPAAHPGASRTMPPAGVQRAASASAPAPARMGVRDAVAQASAGSQSPVNPSGGVTPQSAAPVQTQRASLASAPSAPSAWAPFDEAARPAAGARGPFAPTASAQPGTFTGAAPQGGASDAGTAAGRVTPWGPVTGAGTPAPSAAQQSLSAGAPAQVGGLAQAGAPGQAGGFAPAGAPSFAPGSAGPAGEDAPLVPAWGQVLGDQPAEGVEPVLEEDVPVHEQDAVLGLSWPQIIILVAVGLLLGVLVWLLLEARTPDTAADASADVATVTVDARAPRVL